MRTFWSQERLTAPAWWGLSPVLFIIGAIGLHLAGCSQGTSGRGGLLGRMNLPGSTAVPDTSATSETAPRTASPSDSAVAAQQVERGIFSGLRANRRSTPETPRDPWIRSNPGSTAIPQEGRPVATLEGPSTETAGRTASVERWLEELDAARGRQATAAAPPPRDSVGITRLQDFSPQGSPAIAEASSWTGAASNSRPSSAAALLESGSDRPAWAREPGAQHAPTAPRTTTASREPTPPAPERRLDSLRQVDALLARAHALEAEGKTDEAYRFALVAHQIVQQEQLVIPPGHERPIDYLDSLFSARDALPQSFSTQSASVARGNTIDRPSWSTDLTGGQPDQGLHQPAWPTMTTSAAHNASQASGTLGRSPFSNDDRFAEWIPVAPNQPASLSGSDAGQTPRSNWLDSQTGPTIRPSSFGTRTDADHSWPESRTSRREGGATSDSNWEEDRFQGIQPHPSHDPFSPGPTGPRASEFGPRFSDRPVGDSGFDRTPSNSQPVSLSIELEGSSTLPVGSANLTAWDARHSTQQTITGQGTSFRRESSTPAVWEGGADSTATPASWTNTAPQSPPSTLATVRGPAFGPTSSMSSGSRDGTTSETPDELAQLAMADDSTDHLLADKPLAFWAVIAGLVLLFGCACFRRSSESVEAVSA